MARMRSALVLISAPPVQSAALQSAHRIGQLHSESAPLQKKTFSYRPLLWNIEQEHAGLHDCLRVRLPPKTRIQVTSPLENRERHVDIIIHQLLFVLRKSGDVDILEILEGAELTDIKNEILELLDELLQVFAAIIHILDDFYGLYLISTLHGKQQVKVCALIDGS